MYVLCAHIIAVVGIIFHVFGFDEENLLRLIVFVDAIRSQSLTGKEGEIIFLAVNCNCDKLKGFQILIYHNWELETRRDAGDKTREINLTLIFY